MCVCVLASLPVQATTAARINILIGTNMALLQPQNVTMARSRCSMKWSRKNATLDANRMLELSNGSLIILNVAADDGGEYVFQWQDGATGPARSRDVVVVPYSEYQERFSIVELLFGCISQGWCCAFKMSKVSSPVVAHYGARLYRTCTQSLHKRSQWHCLLWF